jgi:16S rRNA processing protein RimM
MNLPEHSEYAQEWVWLALVRRPQGRKGEVWAEVLTDFPNKFADRRRLWLLKSDPGLKPENSSSASSSAGAVPREVELVSHWMHKGGVVLHFAGVDSISAAEALVGQAVAIPCAERASLGEDEVYISDLVGCQLIDVTPASGPVPVGRIEDVDRSAGPVALLQVRGAAGEILIPFAKNYLHSIDLEAQRVEMALPEGLVDLNTPGKN